MCAKSPKSHDICTSLDIPSVKYLYSSNILILNIAEALISQSPPAQFSLDTSNRNVLFKNDLHVFYHSCPNKKPPDPLLNGLNASFVSGFGVLRGIYLEREN